MSSSLTTLTVSAFFKKPSSRPPIPGFLPPLYVFTQSITYSFTLSLVSVSIFKSTSISNIQHLYPHPHLISTYTSTSSIQCPHLQPISTFTSISVSTTNTYIHIHIHIHNHTHHPSSNIYTHIQHPTSISSSNIHIHIYICSIFISSCRYYHLFLVIICLVLIHLFLRWISFLLY